jgi:hypothetical protein
MEKEELLLNINETREAVKKVQGIHNQLTSLFKKPMNFGCIGHVIAFTVYVPLMSILVGFVLEIFLIPIKWITTENTFDVITTVWAYSILIGIAISYPYAFNLINKKRSKKNEELFNNELVQKLEKEKLYLLQRINDYTVIPEDYRYVNALNIFEKYLVNQRADNLKECINLFEQEKRHEEEIQELKIMQQMQEATYRKANEATTLGWINLFRR